jgi:hypothetical protein
MCRIAYINWRGTMRRITAVAIFILVVVVTPGARAASQPQTITICRTSVIPTGWLIIKEIDSRDCSRNPLTNTGSPNAYVITPTPQVIMTSPSPWSYQLIAATTSGLTVFRWNSQTQQLCKVSVSAGAASFACADVAASVITLPELLRR